MHTLRSNVFEPAARSASLERNVFISYDMDNDKSTVKLLIGQARNDRFPFRFRDYSVKDPYEGRWKMRVKSKIAQSSAVIIAIGRYTHKSSAIDWEIKEAYRQGKKLIGVRLHRGQRHRIPSALRKYGDIVINWNAVEIAREVGHVR